jgi:flagellar biosynthesis/type III secretory pathway protein FliH
MEEVKLSGRDKEVLAAYVAAYRDGHNEGFSNGWSDGYESSTSAYRARLLECFDKDDEIPPNIEALLRATG